MAKKTYKTLYSDCWLANLMFCFESQFIEVFYKIYVNYMYMAVIPLEYLPWNVWKIYHVFTMKCLGHYHQMFKTFKQLPQNV